MPNNIVDITTNEEDTDTCMLQYRFGDVEIREFFYFYSHMRTLIDK